jgi:UDP-glucuronate 4-epimerase
MSVLVTGTAGFLGCHVAEFLLARGEAVLGVDDLNEAYDPALKEARLRRLEGRPGFAFARGDVADPAFLGAWADRHGSSVTGIVHLAVGRSRRGLVDPRETAWRRIAGHLALLALCRHRLPDLRHLVYAEPDECASWHRWGLRDAELILGSAYARLYRVPQTALRLASVYGPWCRPDAACQVMADAILAGRPVTLEEEEGPWLRLAYVADVAARIVAALDDPPGRDGHVPHRLVELGADRSVTAGRLLDLLENALGRTVERRWRPAVAGGPAPEEAEAATALPVTGLEAGIARFAAWHREHHGHG